MTPWSFEMSDHLLYLDPERLMGSGALGGTLDGILTWWVLLLGRKG